MIRRSDKHDAALRAMGFVHGIRRERTFPHRDEAR